MNIFIYITGLASVLGFILQLKDVFPKYRNLRKNIFFVVLGLFIGTLLGGIRIVNLNISLRNTTDFIMIIITCFWFFLICILLLAVVFTKDEKRHGSLIILIEMLVSLFFIFLFFGLIIFLNTGSEYDELSFSELNYLVGFHETNKNYDRSIDLLELIKSKVKGDNDRVDMINNKLESIKKMQIKELNSE